MRAIEPKSLEWAPTAVVQNQGRAHSSASPDAVFAVLADHEAWPSWFPKIKKVMPEGEGVGVGARRIVSLGGLSVQEEFISWEPGRLFAFTGVAVRPRIFSALIEQCVLEPTDDGGTDITWVQSLDPSNAMSKLLFSAARRTVVKSLDTAMSNLARRAETSEQG